MERERQTEIKKGKIRRKIIWMTVSLGALAGAVALGRAKLERTKGEGEEEQVVGIKMVDKPRHWEWLEEEISPIVTLTPVSTSEATVEPIPNTETMTASAQEIIDPEVNHVEIEAILEILKNHPEEFNVVEENEYADLVDIQMYYPIYKAAQERYQVPWYLLWIIHRAESGVSRSKTAFLSGRAHYGAMQRAVAYHSQEIVDEQAFGLEYLAALPQRHPDDWKEIVWAAFKIRANIDQAQSFGEDNPVLFALLRYSAAGPAYDRYEIFKRYQTIFE